MQVKAKLYIWEKASKFVWFVWSWSRKSIQTVLSKIRSQSLDRLSIMKNRVPCVTPACKLWLRRRKRFVCPDEKMALQGLNMQFYGVSIKTTGENLKAKMAGNAFNFYNFLPAFVAALSTLQIEWLA